MKYKGVFLLALLFFLFYSCNSKHKQYNITDRSNDTIMSNISFSKKIFDFGTVSNDTTLEAIFYIKNIGIENLIIKEVSPECSCTGYKLDNETVVAGDSTKLIVNFNTKDKGWGLQTKVIVIKSNTKKEYNTLIIKCKIRNN